MRKYCLSILRQGWLGVPIFMVGLVTLAYSQLTQTEERDEMSPEELSASVSGTIEELKGRVDSLVQQASGEKLIAKRNAINAKANNGELNEDRTRILENVKTVWAEWSSRSAEINKGAATIEGRISEAEKIYSDLEENFAGRMEEAVSALQVVFENLNRTSSELKALEQLLSNASSDANSEFNSLIRESNRPKKPLPPSPVEVSAVEPPRPVTETGKNLAAVINASQAVPLGASDRFSGSIQSDAGKVPTSGGSQADPSNDMIRKLKAELESSKSVQTELSTDTANLQSDLRKAYREIVSLQSSLRESEMMVGELQKTKDSLWKTGDGRLPSADTVSKQISELQRDLELTRGDLRQSRQSLLLEQERSNSMIRSITLELERTRRELDEARVATISSGADSGRLLFLERELAQAKRALQMARSAPQDASSETYLNLQDELRKAMGEIARMQVEIGQKEDLEKQLLQLRSSMEEVGENPSRTASPAYVNKLLIDLNAAKREVAKAKAANQQERRDLAERVLMLENELESTQLELEQTKLDFAKTKESIAKREFEFATTIKKLEEDAQLAQESLSKASIGQLPSIPFVNEMEMNLADSEARMEKLADRFVKEQARATEVIDGLQMELDAALIRQKQAIDELMVREKTLEGKDKEISQLQEERRKLQEELDVVKVIAGQLNDLNEVLEETKSTQSSQSGSMDSIVASLRDELNKAKVELVFALEENDKLTQESSLKIIGLEQQLEDTQARLMMEEDNLVEQTRESKDLMIELKSELDAAREEIARMKTAGLGESVETRQAVSQLQEALGTIRVLQESLNESESINLEVDNLRAELADAMTNQLDALQDSEAEKLKLQRKIDDLEAEVAIIREQGSLSGLAQKKVVTDLNQKLASTQTRVQDLQNQLGDAEEIGIGSLVELEQELAKSRTENQELADQLEELQSTKEKTIELLERELANAVSQLDNIEIREPSEDLIKLREQNQDLLKKLNEKNLRNQSQPSNNTGAQLASQQSESAADPAIAELERQLNEALEQLANLENQRPGGNQRIDSDTNSEALVKLEQELANAEGTVTKLQDQLSVQNDKANELIEELSLATQKIAAMEAMRNRNSTAIASTDSASGFLELEEELVASKALTEELRAKNDLEKEERKKIESKLEAAIQRLSQLEDGLVEPLSNEDRNIVADLQQLLLQKDESITILEEKLAASVEEITNKEAELELAKAMSQSEPNLSGKPDEEEILALQAEIDDLKNALLDLKLENEGSNNGENLDLKKLQNQLQEAVAESMEVQMQLEETKQKLVLLEEASPNGVPDQRLIEMLENAKKSDQQARERIDELTVALRDSETLRKEVESLLMESVEAKPEEVPMNQDPRIIDLQNELMMLQQDLLSARDIEDPRVPQLENELAKSREDSVRLNEEFKNAMQDFGRIKDQLNILEEENRKLNEISLVQARNEAGQANASLRLEFNRSLSEISDLKNRLAERDQRIQNLIDQLAQAESSRPGISPDNSALRAQVVRLQGMTQSANDSETQAKQQIQLLGQQLANANQEIARLENSLRQTQSMARGVPARVSSLSGLNQSAQLSSVQMAELASLRDQNKRLQEQFRNLSDNSDRVDLDRRIQDLNQKNLTAQIQLDQERSRVQDLRGQLEEARNIKQEIIERGQSANMKVNLLNEELEDARSRIGSLEQALVAAREAIRVLQRGGGNSSTVKVSIPSNSSSGLSSRSAIDRSTPTYSPSFSPSVQPMSAYSNRRALPSPTPAYSRSISGLRPSSTQSSSALSVPVVQSVPSGQSTMQLKAQVQFLNNNKRPAGFTEFFLVKDSLDSILQAASIRLPANEGIKSYAEFWARSVQRGYRFPGAAAAIRNALARASLTRLKTNSVGSANIDNLQSGTYFVVGASTLGQVGVVWSKQINLREGENQVSLDLRDAAWAQ